MTNSPFIGAPLLLALCLALPACKKAAPPASAAPTAAQPATAAQAAVQTAATPAGTTANAAAAAVAAPFDFTKVPEATGPIPPFPYVDYPPKVDESSQHTRAQPMDEAAVILGRDVHRLEGRITERTFALRNADMSQLAVRRNYENALKSYGAVKVNIDQPGSHYATGPGMALLRVPDDDMTYDVFLARKGDQRHWVVLMTSDRQARVLSIEETPFTPTIGYEGGAPVTAAGAPPAAAQPLDLAALPVKTATLPPFPYLAYPDLVSEGYRKTRQAAFDAVGVIVGSEVRTVEGKVQTRSFDNKFARMSRMALQRNYEAAIKGLGGVKVNAVAPEDPVLLGPNGKNTDVRARLRIDDIDVPYASYLIRTPGKNIWMALMSGDDRTKLVVVEEQAMEQTVALVSAVTMHTELAARGHIPLYINFDTDRATIRADGQPLIDQITTLLRNDSTLRLSVEGHTDNSGEAQHNLTLSRARAEAVVRQLVANGIAATRLQAAGRGAAAPLADNQEEAGRAKNRRVELVKI